MLDIKLVRSQPDMVKAAMKARNKDYDSQIDEVLQLDSKRRDALAQSEAKKCKQNAASKEIPRIKKEGGDVSAIMAEMKELSAEIKALDAQVSELEQKQYDIIMGIPNIPHESVPIGKDDSDNIEVRRWGEPTSLWSRRSLILSQKLIGILVQLLIYLIRKLQQR